MITSYALLQRDLEDAYLDRTFSVIVLDEAQHIKNRTTRNAKSAKRLNGLQKLVLTGTPVENSVADVWSIFDFLLPDYLGGYDTFSVRVEQPIACGGEEGRAAQERLRHKLHPFILRRLKQTVAKDLPDKIVKVAYCPMTPEQQSWYNRLLAEAKGKIGDIVKAKGFAKSKFEILALLMRLRQVSCHLALLKEYREKNPPGRARSPSGPPPDLSGKLEVFFEMLDEAMDGGHRVLVFSQFVTMLTILRNELEARGIRYCYLDGSTKDRLGECRTFNTDESIPLFLISLHAGGTGLNLTGADMVDRPRAPHRTEAHGVRGEDDRREQRGGACPRAPAEEAGRDRRHRGHHRHAGDGETHLRRHQVNRRLVKVVRPSCATHGDVIQFSRFRRDGVGRVAGAEFPSNQGFARERLVPHKLGNF